jgi:hypothetical protein
MSVILPAIVTGHLITCRTCGAQLATSIPGTIKHYPDGSHSIDELYVWPEGMKR